MHRSCHALTPSQADTPVVSTPAKGGEPVLVGLLTNKAATRVARSLCALRRAIATSRRLVHVEVTGPTDVRDALRLFAAAGVDILIVNGGDGTVQMVAEALGGRLWPGAPPPIAVLAGGHTNLIAKDLGTAGDPVRVFRELMTAIRTHAGRRLAPVRRTPIRLVGGGLSEPRIGFFVGLAAVPRATVWVRRRVQRSLVPLWLRDAASLAFLAASAALGWRRSPLAPVPMTFVAEDGRRLAGRFSVALATPLPRLLLGARLFARHNGETIQFVAFTRTGPRLVRALWAALRGRLHLMAMPELVLERLHELTVEGAADVVVDGELFPLDPAQPLVLETAPALTFLTFREDRS